MLELLLLVFFRVYCSVSAVSSCPVVLVILTNQKRAVSMTTRGCLQITFGITLKRAGLLVLKRAGADFRNLINLEKDY